MIKKRYRYQLFIDGLPNATLEKNGQGVLEPNFKEGIYVGNITKEGEVIQKLALKLNKRHFLIFSHSLQPLRYHY